jgi:hypothetical protein
MHLQPNAVIGECCIVDFLGEGGMGQVYRAVSVLPSTSTQQRDLRRVAIDVPDGGAEVWEDGQLFRHKPFIIAKPYGDSLKLVLHQSGYDDLPVQFEIRRRSEYIDLMRRSDAHR